MKFSLNKIFGKKTNVKEEENKSFNAIPILEKTNKMDLYNAIFKRQNVNLEKLTNVSKINQDMEKYSQMITEFKNKGATERQLANIREKMQELVIERQKIEVLTVLVNQDHLVKTAYGKKRQTEIYSFLYKKYENRTLDLIKFKGILEDLSITLKSKTDERTETQRLEDFFSGLY